MAAIEARLMASRQVYEFPQDHIRLDLIGTARDLLQKVFNFQAVQLTVSTGIIFSRGTWHRSADSPVVAIRRLQIEPRLIIIDVDGGSDLIPGIFEFLVNCLKEIRTSEPTPLIGEYERVYDHSEISCRLDFEPNALLSPTLVRIVGDLPSMSGDAGEVGFVPVITVSRARQTEEFGTTTPLEARADYQITLRVGTRPADRVFFSAAPLSSSDHLRFLDELNSELSQNPA